MPEESKTKPKIDETKVTTDAGTIKIEQPRSRQGKALQKVSVIIGPDEVIGGFAKFIREHAVVGVAVGFAIGSQAQVVIKQLITGFLDPASQLLFGTALSQRTFTWHFNGRHADFGWGGLFSTVLNFIFVLAAIYVIIKLFNLDKLEESKKK